MADKRTIRRVLHGLAEGTNPTTKIKGYAYTVDYSPSLGIRLTPVRGGAVASSLIEYDSPDYDQWGDIFKLAVDLAKEIDAEMRRKLRGTA